MNLTIMVWHSEIVVAEAIIKFPREQNHSEL